MCADSGTVLVLGVCEQRVVRVAEQLAVDLPVRTFVTTGEENWPTTDVEVVVWADGSGADLAALETLPEDTARVAVFENPEAFDHDRHAGFDRVLVEPLVLDDLQTTVASLARRVRYDRRLRECAELAAQCRRNETNSNVEVLDHGTLYEEVEDAKAELDGLVAQFTTEDFRQAFQTLAAD